LPHTFLSFFILSRRPLISPLFPYTTLFRSCDPSFSWTDPSCSSIIPLVKDRVPSASSLAPVFAALKLLVNLFILFTYSCCPDARDRKSTRLNSSHVSISYAVFFLKKKNITL